jgi:hypothetical protein
MLARSGNALIMEKREDPFGAISEAVRTLDSRNRS